MDKECTNYKLNGHPEEEEWYANDYGGGMS